MLIAYISIGDFTIQRYIPQRGLTPLTMRVVLRVKDNHERTFQYLALTSGVRVDGRTPLNSDLWIKLSDFDDSLNLIQD